MRKSLPASTHRPLLIPLIAFACVSVCAGAGAKGAGAAGADSISSRAPDDVRSALRVEEGAIRLGSGDLREPTGLAIDVRGFVYVADAMAGKVFRYSPLGESLEFERPPDRAAFYPIDIAVQESFILVLDYSRNAILRFDLKGAFLDVLFSFAEFGRMHPVSLTAGAGGRIITTDLENDSVALWTPLLDLEIEIGEFGWSEGRFNEPRKAAFLPDSRIVVAESANRRIQLFSPAGSFERTLTAPDSAFASLRSVCADEMGRIFACDAEGGRIVVYSPEGAHLLDIDSFSTAAIAPAAAAAGWDDALYVADLKSRSILIYRLLPARDE